MEDMDIGVVDPDLGRFRSPVKMARKALEGLAGVTWIEPSPRERAKVKDAFRSK